MLSLMAGDCIELETNVDKEGYIQRHWCILLFDGETHTNTTIIVPIDTLRSDKQDKTILLLPEDCGLEFIKNISYIHYNRARTISITSLIQKIEKGEGRKMDQKVNDDLLAKIREGVRKSKGTRHEILTEYSYRMF